MLQKLAALLLMAAGFSFGLSAQSGSVSGSVRNHKGDPVINAAVIILNSVHSTVTDADGKFFFDKVEAGNYDVAVRFGKGAEITSVVTVEEGKNTVMVPFVINANEAELDEFVVSAEKSRYKEDDPSASLRLAEPLLEIPQNVQVVSKTALADQQVISMSDGVLRNVSGTVRSEHWADLYTNVISRGSQVQAFRNGFNVVNSYWGPLTEDMSFVDRIEFVKGPAGFMLSNGDPSGLYNVVTKKPTGKEKGEVSLTMGSFDLYRATFDIDGKLSKDGRLLYRLNGAAQNKKSFRQNEFNDRYAIAPVISYQLDSRTKLTFEYNYQRANMSNVGSYYMFSPTGYESVPRNASWLPAGLPSTVINDHSAYIYLEHKISRNWKFNAQVTRFAYYQEGSSFWPSSVNPDGTFIRNVSIWDSKSIMTMGQGYITGDVKTGAIRHRILAGIDQSNKQYWADWGQSHDLDTAGAAYNPYDPYLGAPVNGYPVFDRSVSIEQRAAAIGATMDSRYGGIYVQDELGFFDNKLRLTLAGRYSYITQAIYGGAAETAKRFTPRVGLSANITKNTTVYALYDQSFIPQSGQLANGRKVQPITGNNQEIGIKKDWFDGKWNTTLSIYRILKNNELTADPFSPPTSGLSIELGQKVAQGVEFDVRGTIFPGFNVVANYAYTDSKVLRVAEGVTAISAGDIVPGFSRHTANFWLSYKIQDGFLKGFGASLGGTFLGDRQMSWDIGPAGGDVLPDYKKVDAGLFWENNKLRITANAFNILSENLYSGSYYAYLNAYYFQAEPLRNFRVGMSYSF